MLKFFNYLKTLKQLDLCVFDFIELPRILGQLYALELQSLHKLNLSDCNNLKQFPEELGELRALMEVDLSKCYSLQELPDNFGKLTSL